MEPIDLNDVAVFIRVADRGSLTAVAKTLGVTKSSVSRSLARLERVLGVRLAHRTTHALALTEAGRAYYERVRDLVAGVAEASAHVVDLGQEPRGLIRVTAPVDLAEAFLAGVIARFVERHPQVRFDVMLTSRLVDLVAEGFDVAVRASHLRDSSLVVRKLGEARLGLFASRAYLRRRGVPNAVSDLAAHDFVRFRPFHGPLEFESDARKERVVVEGAIEADDLLFVRRLILAGAGIGLLPLFLMPESAEARRAKVTRVLPAWTIASAALSVMIPSARHEPRRVKLFREFVIEEAKRQGLTSR